MIGSDDSGVMTTQFLAAFRFDYLARRVTLITDVVISDKEGNEASSDQSEQIILFLMNRNYQRILTTSSNQVTVYFMNE